jgi:hypothetical protein
MSRTPAAVLIWRFLLRLLLVHLVPMFAIIPFFERTATGVGYAYSSPVISREGVSVTHFGVEVYQSGFVSVLGNPPSGEFYGRGLKEQCRSSRGNDGTACRILRDLESSHVDGLACHEHARLINHIESRSLACVGQNASDRDFFVFFGLRRKSEAKDSQPGPLIQLGRRYAGIQSGPTLPVTGIHLPLVLRYQIFLLRHHSLSSGPYFIGSVSHIRHLVRLRSRSLRQSVSVGCPGPHLVKRSFHYVQLSGQDAKCPRRDADGHESKKQRPDFFRLEFVDAASFPVGSYPLADLFKHGPYAKVYACFVLGLCIGMFGLLYAFARPTSWRLIVGVLLIGLGLFCIIHSADLFLEYAYSNTITQQYLSPSTWIRRSMHAAIGR